MCRQKQRRAQHRKGVIGTLTFRCAFESVGNQRRDPRDALAKCAPDLLLGRREPKILGEGDAEPAQIRRVRRSPTRRPAANGFARQRIGQGIARIVAGHHREHQRRIGDVARHRPVSGEAGPALQTFLAGDEAVGRTQADDAAKAGRIAQATAGIRARGQRCHPAGERDRRTSGGAGCGFHWVERVASRPVNGVAGVAAGRPFRRVGLAEDDGAGRAQPRDRALIGRGHVLGKQRAAIGRAQAGGVLGVLDQNG